MLSTTEYVFVSALTSAVVVLGIEWLANPSLDARKERILAARRERCRFGDRLQQILVTAAVWKDTGMPAGLSLSRGACW